MTHVDTAPYAWIANWACMVMLFGGLVMLGHQTRETALLVAQSRELAEQQRTQIENDVADLQERIANASKPIERELKANQIEMQLSLQELLSRLDGCQVAATTVRP